MEKINQIVKNHIFIILSSIIFLIIAIIYAHVKVGFLSDFEVNFYLAITSDTIWHTRDFDGFFLPLYARYFPLILPHLSVTVSMLLGLSNIKYLLYIFTFISYSYHAVFLIIIYFNFPNDKKRLFEVIFLSFMVSFFYLQYFIFTESFLTGLFIWVIFVIYFYSDFNQLSFLNSISLIIFSVAISSSYPSVIFFIPILLFFGVIKYLKTKNIKKINRIIIIFSFVVLLVAFIFNIYYIFHPEISLTSSNLNLQMFKDLNFVCILMFAILTLVFSFLKSINRYKKIFIIITIIFSIAVGYFLLQIHPKLGHLYRALGFCIPFIFMLFLICVAIFKLNLEFVYIKILNLALIFWLLIGNLIYAKHINDYNLKIINYMLNNKTITIEKFQRKNTRDKFAIYYAVLLKTVFLKTNNSCKLLILSQDEHQLMHVKYIIKNKSKNKKLGIDIEKFIEII